MNTTAKSQENWPLPLVLLAGGVHLVSALWHILYGGMNTDEGFYAIAARSVWQGDVPYRDFGHTQMPLLPYINGLFLQFTGFGLFAQRAINGLWGALTLVLAARWLARRTNPSWALGLVALLSLSALWMYFTHLGKTYAFSGLMVMAAGYLYTEGKSGIKKIIGLALLGTLAAGCRLPLAPFFAVLWCAAIIETHSLTLVRRLLIALGSLTWPVVLVLPFYLAALEAAIFWTLEFHLDSVPDRAWRLTWLLIAAMAPAVWLAFAGMLAQTVIRPSATDRRELILALATAITLGTNLMPRGAFEEYGVPLLPALALVSAAGLWRWGDRWPRIRHPLTPLILLAANLTLTVALQWPHLQPEVRGTWSMFLPLTAPAYDPTLPQDLARAKQTVTRYLPPEQPLIGPMIILAAETGHPVPRDLRMGACSATADFAAAQAHRLNLVTVPELEARFTDPAMPLVVLSKNPHNNYLCSMPTFRNLSAHKAFSWSALFQRDFMVAYEDANFLVLVRKPSPDMSPTP